MDARHFDVLVKALLTPGSRRRLAAFVVTLPAVIDARQGRTPDAVAGKRRRKRRKDKKSKPACKPDPIAQTCDGQCGTLANNCQQTVDCGSCVCDVRCISTPAACGAALQSAIDAAPEGATLIVCPGIYQGGFTISKSLTMIGAGQGDNPARSTILDGNKTQRVLEIQVNTGPVTLQRLQITRGEAGTNPGGGIRNAATQLTMQDCTIASNHSRSGGGIAHDAGFLQMTNCTVRDNLSDSLDNSGGDGGGLVLNFVEQVTLTDCQIAGNKATGLGGGFVYYGTKPVILGGTTVVRDNVALKGGGIFAATGPLQIGVNCRITRNTAEAGQGGGISRGTASVTLEGPDPSPIVVDNCHENCVVNILKCASGGTCPV